ncbi:hypothetical protein GRX03_03395 [Halovenus sp. WSH3]|uniref:Uncharacterized protein n=1 Tax=Halovenus carboxidivorans TaxID=2692199 RepID=A0A6B0SYK3_9EURY|nr:hypothetical protein [Halovenus carboxidivorans]MXR50654.1 hypothetical protein [Halovenus carboxidivorans]
MVEFVFEPSTTIPVLCWLFAGAALGTLSGLTPGLHANNFALLLAGFALSGDFAISRVLLLRPPPRGRHVSRFTPTSSLGKKVGDGSPCRLVVHRDTVVQQ